MIGDEDEKKYITIIKISLICFFGFLITLFIAFFIAIDYVDAEAIETTMSEGYWYSYNGNQLTTTQVSTGTRATETFYIYQYQTPTPQLAQFKTSVYFSESLNDKIINGKWDISFSMIGTGDFAIRVGQNSCFLTSSTSITDTIEMQYNQNESGYIPAGNKKYYDVWCPNVDITQVPVTIKIFRQQTYTEQFENYIAFNKWWGFSSTINEFNDTNIINAISGIGSAINNATNSDNQNTQDIINNQNEIAQEQEESQKVCEKIDKNLIEINNKYININGNEVDNNSYGITSYINVTNGNLKALAPIGYNTQTSLCFYNINKTLISCINNNSFTANSNINIPNQSSYARFSIDKSRNLPTFELCKNGNQAISDNQQQINDTLNDSSIDDPSSNLSQMESQMPTNSTISDLLTLPVRLFQNVINAIDGNCSPFSLGSLYGTNITLPCINLQNLIGSNLYGVIDVILSGIFVLSIRKKFVDIFENLTSLKNGGNELE